MKKTNSIQDTQIALAKEQKKTNIDWHKIEMLGSYFKFDNGILLQCPMNADGTRDTTPCEVEWERVEADDVDGRRLRAVAQALAANP